MGWIEEKRILLNLCCGVLQLTRFNAFMFSFTFNASFNSFQFSVVQNSPLSVFPNQNNFETDFWSYTLTPTLGSLR